MPTEKVWYSSVGLFPDSARTANFGIVSTYIWILSRGIVFIWDKWFHNSYILSWYGMIILYDTYILSWYGMIILYDTYSCHL